MNTSGQTVFRFLSLTLVALAGFSINPQNVARAVEPGRDPPPSVRVSFADLNLANPQGTAVLYLRIRNAARTVCGPVDVALLEEWVYWNRCVDASIAHAVAKVGNADLTAYYLTKTNRSHSIATAQISKRVDVR